MKPKILIAESEQMFAEAIAYVLEQEGFEIIMAHDGREALVKAKELRPHLCILSAAFSPVSCYQLCCDIRRKEGVGLDSPILLLGTDSHEETRVAMLECGVDDYLVKPFGMREFMARIYALLRRAKPLLEIPHDNEVRSGNFVLSAKEQIVTIESEDGSASYHLTRKESQLQLLMSQAGTIVPHNKIVEFMWNTNEASESRMRTLFVHLRSLPCKLEADANNPQHLIVLRNVGMKFQN